MGARLRVAAVAAALGAAILVWTPIARAQTPPPIEAYTSGPRVSSIGLSADGRRLVVTTSRYTTERDYATLQVINLANNEVERAFDAPANSLVSGAFWIDDRRIIFSVRPSQRAGANVLTQNFGRGYGLFDVETGSQRLVQARGFVGPYWVPGDAMAVRVVGYEWDPNRGSYSEMSGYGRRGVIRVDLAGRNARHIANLNDARAERTADLLLADDGELLARVDTNSGTNRWRFLVYESGGLRSVLEGIDEIGAPPDLAGILPDGRWAIVTRRDEEDRWRMFAFDRHTGQFEMIADHERYDMSSGIHDRWTNRVIGVRWVEEFPRQRFFDPALQTAYEHLAGVFASGYATISSWSRDRSRVVVFGETPEDPGSYYLFDTGSRSLQLLRRTYPQLTGAAALGDRQSITYRARDGTRIPAYLTLPANAAQNLPLVVMPHGGPHARDDFTFDPTAGFLASRGYAVLQPNFRGSTGFGYAWFNAGRGNWGVGIMQTDVDDGVNALVRSGIADPNRVCIVGASYGGYAALVGATLTPDRYRCAISIVGVSDLVRMLDEYVPGSQTADWWRLSMGDPRADREHLRAVSPVNFADRVRIPILLIHGREDPIVPVIQSRIMYDRLRGAGKDVRYIEIEHEGHGFFMEENRVREFREIEAFLAQHIGGGAASAQ